MAKTYLATKAEVQTLDTTVTTIDQQLNTATTGIEARVAALETGNGTVIVDNLTSTSTTSALSAARGKELRDLITTLQTLGTRVTTSATDTLVAFTEEDVLQITLPSGKWIVYGSVAMNQTNIETASDYICGVITTNPTAYNTQEVFASNAESVIGRMSGGADLAMTFPTRYYTSSGTTIVTMRLLSSFTTDVSEVKSAMSAVKVGI